MAKNHTDDFNFFNLRCIRMKLLVKINDYIFSKDIAEANAVDPYGAFAWSC